MESPTFGGRVRVDTILRARRVRPDTSAPLQIQPPHDVEQARVVGKAEVLSGTGYMPIVPLQCRDYDLSLGFCLQSGEPPIVVR
jgi:hypothetical protein